MNRQEYQKNQRDQSFWRWCLIAGFIALNVLLFFREPAWQAGTLSYVGWSAVVAAVGVLMVYSIFRMRRLRLEGQRELERSVQTAPVPRRVGAGGTGGGKGGKGGKKNRKRRRRS